MSPINGRLEFGRLFHANLPEVVFRPKSVGSNFTGLENTAKPWRKNICDGRLVEKNPAEKDEGSKSRNKNHMMALTK